MSLADELLADLEAGGEESTQNQDEAEDEAPEVEEVAMETDTDISSVKNIAKLCNSEEVKVAKSYML